MVWYKWESEESNLKKKNTNKPNKNKQPTFIFALFSLFLCFKFTDPLF